MSRYTRRAQNHCKVLPRIAPMPDKKPTYMDTFIYNYKDKKETQQFMYRTTMERLVLSHYQMVQKYLEHFHGCNKTATINCN